MGIFACSSGMTNNFIHEIMNRLLVIPLILCVTNSQLARVPKIYNALITSDENLSPSQAYPIIEPILRTTALGVAFPPLVVHPQIYNLEPPPNTLYPAQQHVNSNAKEVNPLVQSQPQQQPQSQSTFTFQSTEDKKQKLPQPELTTYHGSLYPLAFDPYLPYGYRNEFLYPPFPFYQQPVYVDFGHYDSNSNHNNNHNGNGSKQEEENGNAEQVQLLPPHFPPKSAINFKKNPDIPDVLPPLPIRNERKNKS